MQTIVILNKIENTKSPNKTKRLFIILYFVHSFIFTDARSVQWSNRSRFFRTTLFFVPAYFNVAIKYYIDRVTENGLSKELFTNYLLIYSMITEYNT